MNAITSARMKFISALLTFATALSAHALTPNVDLKDLAKYVSADQVQAQQMIDLINQDPTRYGVPVGITYSGLKAVGQSAISTISVQNQTPYGADLFLIYTSNKSVFLNKVAIDIYGNPQRTETLDLTKNPPTVQIDILNRQFTLRESKTGFLRYAPAAMGSLIHQQINDNASPYQSLSRPFRSAYLSRSKSELSRTKPDYYAGRPFLRIIDNEQNSYGGFTPFGLHYQISDELQRGFISNGCFRLRDNDLFELSNLVFFSKKQGVPLSVVNSTQDGNRHPYPIIKRWFNTPRVGLDKKGQAAFLEDEHGLYIFDRVDGLVADLLQAAGY